MLHTAHHTRWKWGLLACFCLTSLASLTALCIGTVSISPATALHALYQSLSNALMNKEPSALTTNEIILFELRAPRVLMAILIGASLAIVGTIFQSMLRNPLADPYLLGISSGAACGAVVALMLDWPAIPFSAFAGALLSAILVVLIAHRTGNMHTHTLLLAGVVVNAFLASIIAILITFSSAHSTQGIVFWLMGNISTQNITTLMIIGSLILISMSLLFWKSRSLDLLAQGEPIAKQLGLEVEHHKWFLLLLTSLLTGVAVAYNGLIGFVGLIVPHIGRFLIGSDNRLLIPISALLGATVMVIADTLARTIIAPAELPVGAITALAGAPFFLILLKRARHTFT